MAVAALPLDPIEISYGDFKFPPDVDTVGFRGQAVWDQAGRTITHIVYTITLRFYHSQLDKGTGIETIRRTLMHPARPFVYKNNAFGNLELNTRQTDVVWGPKPQSFNFEPLGAGNAAKIEWTVEIAISECRPRPAGKIMEFNYDLEIQIDQSGLTRRSYSGFLRIPQTRRAEFGHAALQDNADNYRKLINPPLIEGFRRIPGTFTLDKSKCVLSFQIVDEELPTKNVPPPFVISCSAEHYVESDNVALTSWHAGISASYEMVKGAPRELAFSYFIQLVNERIVEPALKSEALTVIPTKIVMREPALYDRQAASFILTYRYTTTLEKILKASGLWQPVKNNSDWQKWSDSLKITGANTERGLARLIFQNGDDAILDLCQPDSHVPQTPAGAKLGPLPVRPDELAKIFKYPEADKSWLDFFLANYYIPVPQIAVQDKLPNRQPPGVVDKELRNILPGQLEDGALAAPGKPGEANGQRVIQVRVEPAAWVMLHGYAVRAGYPIAEPRLKSYGGAQAILANRKGIEGFESAVIGNFGVPIIKARWSQRYALRTIPTKPITQFPNPLLEKGKTADLEKRLKDMVL